MPCTLLQASKRGVHVFLHLGLSSLNLLSGLFLYITPFLVTAGTYARASTLTLPWCAICINVESNKKMNTIENQKAEPWPNTVFGGCWLKIQNEICITKYPQTFYLLTGYLTKLKVLCPRTGVPLQLAISAGHFSCRTFRMWRGFFGERMMLLSSKG